MFWSKGGKIRGERGGGEERGVESICVNQHISLRAQSKNPTSAFFIFFLHSLGCHGVSQSHC